MDNPAGIGLARDTAPSGPASLEVLPWAAPTLEESDGMCLQMLDWVRTASPSSSEWGERLEQLRETQSRGVAALETLVAAEKKTEEEAQAAALVSQSPCITV